MKNYLERLQVGDRVKVFWDNQHYEVATIIALPQNVGDLIQVKYDEGRIHAINPYTPKFVCLEKIKESEKE